MKHLLSGIAIFIFIQSAHAQITITASDMPVSGDTLRYSIASPVGAVINPGDSGANVTWNYSLTPVGQAVDTYKTALQVNLLYVVTVGVSAFGYKVADTLPGATALPVSINQVYTFFEEKTSPASFQATAFAASISGLPTAAQYSTPDIWYYFPLSYTNNDSSAFALNIAIPSLGGLKETGYRKTRVDGWGTIVTPYYTTPVNCIRVRSEVHQVDSITFDGFSFGIPNNTVEYKWLVNGDHFPALWVTSNVIGGTETITGIQYRDNFRAAADNAASSLTKTIANITAYPNPAFNGLVTLGLPQDWKTFTVTIFDANGKIIGSFKNKLEINIQALPAGQYIAQVTSGNNIGYIALTK